MVQPVPRPKISSAPSRHVYDVIVVGGQLGAPLAGAVLAKRGYRVLYVEHDGQGPGYEHAEHLLPYAPFVAPPLKAMPVVEETLKELGLNTTVQRSLQRHTPELQLIYPRHRVDLPQESARRRAELVREFGDEGARAFEELERFAPQHETSDAFLKEAQDLPPSGMMSKWRAKRQVSAHPEIDHASELSEALPGSGLLKNLLPFVTWLDSPSEPLPRTRPLAQVLRAPCRYPGGRDGLRELLVKKLEDLGGHVLSRHTSDAYIVEQLTFEGSKLAGIQILQSANVYRSSAVVMATDAGALRRLIPDKKKHRDLTETLDLVETKQFLFTVNWVVPEKVLPRGMGELMLMDTGDELKTLLIQVHQGRKATGEDIAGVKVLCAGAFVPSTVRDLGEEKLVSLKAQIEGHLERLLPFVRPQVVLSSAPYLDAGGVRGSRLLPHPLLQVDTERYAGITGLPPQTPVKNLILASREVLPGLGLEGELMAGVRAAGVVHELLHKKKPL